MPHPNEFRLISYPKFRYKERIRRFVIEGRLHGKRWEKNRDWCFPYRENSLFGESLYGELPGKVIFITFSIIKNILKCEKNCGCTWQYKCAYCNTNNFTSFDYSNSDHHFFDSTLEDKAPNKDGTSCTPDTESVDVRKNLVFSLFI